MRPEDKAVVQQLMDAARVAGITVQCAVVQQQVSAALAAGKALLEQPAAWVGLDGLEMSDLWLDTPFDDCTEETFEAGRAFIEAIEAKLREKNGGAA
jgi:hypothetical protein